jgi:tripartite-type tricarboxylate transporter receptor subunit TctC
MSGIMNQISDRQHSRAADMRRVSIAPLLFALSVVVIVCPQAQADDYPNRPIRIVQPFPAGGPTDVLARGLGQKLSEALGQPVIVEARPGANGILGAQSVAKSAPDGYTMLLTTGSHTANPHVAKSLTYNALGDFTAVTQLAGSYGLALLTNLPVNSVGELVALAKQKPGALSYATSGVGNLTHVAGRLFEARTGISMVAIPYNTPTLLTDVVSGTVSLTFNSLITAVTLVNQKQIKVLAITGDRRSPALPDTPTMSQAGVKNYELTGYFGVLFPAGVPRARVELIHREAVKALATPQLKRIVEDNGLYIVGSTPDEFNAYLKRDYEFQGGLMEELGLKVKRP